MSRTAKPTNPTNLQLEDLLHRYHANPPDHPDSQQLARQILLGVRGIVVVKAEAIHARHPSLPLEDLIQVGLLVVLEKLPGFRPGRAKPGQSLFPGWVARVAHNQMAGHTLQLQSPINLEPARHAAKRRRRKGLVPDPLPVFVCEENPASNPDLQPQNPEQLMIAREEAEDEDQLHEQLGEAINKLSARDQRLIHALYWQEGSEGRFITIAKGNRKKALALQQRARRILQHLREQLT